MNDSVTNFDKMPSPILMIGDAALCKNNIVLGKKKYNEANWIEMSFSDHSVDEIRGESSSLNLFMSPKVIVLKDFPNQKAIREFILNLISTQGKVKFVVWDSLNQIKPDPKKGTFNKTWSDWIDEIKNISSSKFINNGFVSNEKDSIGYIQSLFKKKKINCEYNVARLFTQIVGGERGIIDSEVNKLSLVVENSITEEEVLQYAYPITQEAVIYQLGSALDSNNYSLVISTLEDFLSKKIHVNVLCEILMKRARWQLIVLDKWSRNIPWANIEKELMSMGSFPSSLVFEDKVKASDRLKIKKELSDPIKAKEYMTGPMGMPDYYFERLNEKGSKLKKSDKIPLPFIATQITQYVKDIIIHGNISRIGSEATKSIALSHGMETYLGVSEGLKRIRYGANEKEELYEMIKILMSNNFKQTSN